MNKSLLLRANLLLFLCNISFGFSQEMPIQVSDYPEKNSLECLPLHMTQDICEYLDFPSFINFSETSKKNSYVRTQKFDSSSPKEIMNISYEMNNNYYYLLKLVENLNLPYKERSLLEKFLERIEEIDDNSRITDYINVSFDKSLQVERKIFLKESFTEEGKKLNQKKKKFLGEMRPWVEKYKQHLDR